MRVAIAGGRGFLGRHVARALVARGDDVVILTRDPDRSSRRAATDAPGARTVGWGPSDPLATAEALRGMDAVINLAGVPIGPLPWFPSRRRAIRTSRIESTATIVRAIGILDGADRPATLLSASGTDRYTGLDASPADETAPSADGYLAEVCAAWEAEAMRARTFGVRVAFLRFGLVLGTDAPVVAAYAAPFRIGLGGPIGDGRQWMSWVHVDDVVGIVLAALDDPRIEGSVNVVSPEPARQAEVAAAIGAALGRRSWLRVPAWLVRLALGEASILALGSRRVVPARVLALGYAFRWRNLGAAMTDVLGRSGAAGAGR